MTSKPGARLGSISIPTGTGGISIWRVPAEGGEAVPITSGGDSAEEGTFLLEQFDMATGETKPLSSLRPERGFGAGLSVSPNGEWALVSLGEPQTGDIYLVESVR